MSISSLKKPRSVTENTFASFDGTRLFYRAWSPTRENSSSKRALIVVHRGHEHSGRLHDLIDGLGLDDYAAFGFDCRGHGMSPGARGFAPDFSFHVKDLDTFARYICEKYGYEMNNVSVVANSVGAVVTSAWVHDYAPQIRCMVLAAPAFDIKLYIPGALNNLRLLNMIKKPAFISSYVKGRLLTHDPVQAKMYNEDKLITPQIAVNILIDLHDTAKRVIKDAAAITTPTLIFSAGSDWVVKQAPQKQFFDGLSSKVKEFVELKGFFHGVFYEKERHIPLKKAGQFVERCFAENLQPVSLLDADQTGSTYLEYSELLKGKVSLINKINYAMQRFTLKTMGLLSKGIQLGYTHGFDSGMSLDHVYRNKPEGVSFIGRIIDYFYINAVGWKGIRLRKINLEETIRGAVANVQKRGEKAKVMDIAAGGAAYLLEIAERFQKEGNQDVEFLIRDYDMRNIRAAEKRANEMGLKNVRFMLADAFDPKTYTNMDYTPNILVISGLFELFPANDMILRALKGATSLLKEGSYVLYTGQPWHPQLELIAHTLPNREGQPWIMRRRTQGELDNLFQSVGIQKLDMQIDKFGIFTVSTGVMRVSAKNSRAG
jgi:alpha-beta hydrolase superfamily lysophospholipase/ubiquinone/menaquinone biosynthesis C-methylase UbiE